MAHLAWSALPTALAALLRALEIAEDEGLNARLSDVVRLEAWWEVLEEDSGAHGFVVRFRAGRRAYLQYIIARGEPAIEEVQLLPMGNERFPSISGGSIAWNDDVQAMNLLLTV